MTERIALITGASKGIGSGIAKSFAASGYRVAIAYNSNEEKANKLVEELIKNGQEAIAIKLNVEDRSSVQNAIQVINSVFGKVSILINNAAISQEKPFEDITDIDWDTMMGINLRGPFSLIQEVLPEMISDRFGRIINISSIGGQWGGMNQVHYAASKAALINLTRSISKLYSRYGITSNAIAPGLVATDMSKNELSSDAGKKKVANIPSLRLGTVEELGSIAVFIASQEAEYITGQTINVNGGMFFST